MVKVTGTLTLDQVEQFRRGVPLSGKRTMPAELKLIKEGENPWYEVKLTEGRNQQIRLMFKHFGFLVEKLRRVKVGPIELGPIRPGQFRHLTDEEVQKLKRAIEHTLARLDAPLSFGEVAQAALVSERTLARRFAEETNMTWRQFLRRARMIRSLGRK